jgi:hypothetical protein
MVNSLLSLDTFPSIGSGTWTNVRTTVNFQSNAGLSDVTSEQIRCYTTSGQRAPQIQSVAAGGSVTFTASPNIFHPGPLQFYMAKVPSGQTAATWDGSGKVWFKTYAEQATVSGGQLSWGSLSTQPQRVPLLHEVLTQSRQGNCYRQHPKELAIRRLPPADRTHCPAPGKQRWWSSILHFLRANQRHRWRKWHSWSSCLVPWCILGKRPRYQGQHLLCKSSTSLAGIKTANPSTGCEIVHSPWPYCLDGLNVYRD